MSLTVCNETSYPCHNGLCIPMKNKCDTNYDCSDNSDEEDCDKVLKQSGYNKDFLKNKLDSHQQVNMTFRLDSFLDIREEHQRISLLFTINLLWYDSRLTFHDL